MLTVYKWLTFQYLNAGGGSRYLGKVQEPLWAYQRHIHHNRVWQQTEIVGE